MIRTIAIVCVTLAIAGTVPAQQLPRFRTTVDVVTLDVSVLRNNKNVTTLAAEDFIVTDNGVRQTVEVVAAGSLPLDVTLVVDQSGSMAAAASQIAQQLRDAAALLKPVDRVRLMTFSETATIAFDLQDAATGFPIGRLAAGGSTSLLDALAAAMIRERPPDRNELAVILSDGLDTSSVLAMSLVQQIARRSDIPLHVFITYRAEDAGAVVTLLQPDYGPLEDLARVTGGQLQKLLANKAITEALTRVLDDYRSSYTLRYTATGVPRSGWHELAVSVNQPGTFTVRARKGYFGG